MSGEARELRRLATLDRNRGAEQIRWSFDIFEPEDDGQPARYITARKWYKADGAEWETDQGRRDHSHGRVGRSD